MKDFFEGLFAGSIALGGVVLIMLFTLLVSPWAWLFGIVYLLVTHL